MKPAVIKLPKFPGADGLSYEFRVLTLLLEEYAAGNNYYVNMHDGTRRTGWRYYKTLENLAQDLSADIQAVEKFQEKKALQR